MNNTTIAISKEVRDKVIEFGSKGETYSEIIERLVKSARDRQLHDILFNEKGFISIKEAMAEAEKKWPKSK